MTHPSRIKGNAYEALVVGWLREHGFPDAARTLSGAALDRGDISGVPGFALQCKNHRALDLGTWMNDLADQCENARAFGAIIHKRRGRTDPALSYVTMDLATFAWLLRRAEP